MNIQMILSALPASHTGTSQSGTESGQFALALGHAIQGKTADHGHAAAFGTTLPKGLPSDLAGREALLQALHAAGYSLNGDGEAVEADARLDDIMQRLELIAAQHEPVLPADELSPLAPLPEAVAGIAPEIDDSATAAEAGVPHALATVAVSLEPRQQIAASQGELRGSPGQAAPLHSAQTAELLANTAQAGEHRPALAGAEVRRADNAAATTLLRTAAAQVTPGELASLNTEAPRGGFVPEAATFAATSTSTSNGHSASTAQPALPAHTTLSAPVQSQAWSNQLGQQLVQFARQGGEQRIEMRLNPAELGPLSVTLKTTEQGAQAQFLSAHAPVRQALEQAIPQLREALAEQGISLGEASVGEQRQQDAQTFAGGQSGQGQRGTTSDSDLDLADSDTLTPATSATVALDGRVDLYA